MKHTHLTKFTIYLLFPFLLIQLVSCEENETTESVNLKEEQLNSGAKNLTGTPSRYHFIRFNVNDRSIYNLLATKIKDLTRNNGGVVLTEGKPIDCLERNCEDITFVLSFFSEVAEVNFSTQFSNLKLINSKGITNLSYATAVPFSRPELFAQSIDNAYYFVGNGNFLNIQRYVTEYGPNAIALIEQNGGALISADFRTPNCVLGDCNFFNVLIQFPSLRAAEGWYN